MATIKTVPPKSKASPPPAGRYSQRAVALEVAQAIARGGRGTHKELAAALGMTSQQLSHRLAGDIAKFSVEELGQAADYFNAPPGWPFVAWTVAAAIFSRR